MRAKACREERKSFVVCLCIVSKQAAEQQPTESRHEQVGLRAGLSLVDPVPDQPSRDCGVPGVNGLSNCSDWCAGVLDRQAGKVEEQADLQVVVGARVVVPQPLQPVAQARRGGQYLADVVFAEGFEDLAEHNLARAEVVLQGAGADPGDLGELAIGRACQAVMANVRRHSLKDLVRRRASVRQADLRLSSDVYRHLVPRSVGRDFHARRWTTGWYMCHARW